MMAAGQMLGHMTIFHDLAQVALPRDLLATTNWLHTLNNFIQMEAEKQKWNSEMHSQIL